MGKNALWLALVIVVGALLGSFLGSLIGLIMPPGPLQNLFMQDISAGLNPTSVDLRIIVLTFGCVIRINLMCILGIIAAAVLFKKLAK